MNRVVPSCRSKSAFVGMVHLLPLPGSPRFGAHRMAKIIDRALIDARALMEGGCDALLIENMGDVPYLKGTVQPESVAAAAVCAARVAELGLPIGIQLLAAANREALGVAIATGASFIRVEGFAYAHVADEGWVDACAGELLRARAALAGSRRRPEGGDAPPGDHSPADESDDPPVAIWADVQKKHSAHAITGDLSVAELAQGAAFCGAEALVITGTQTGALTDLADIQAARTAGLPVVVGSGVGADNASSFAAISDALIVGTSLKVDANWRNPVDLDRVSAVRAAIDAATG